MKTIFITGGAGFIGSHTVREFVKNLPNYRIVNIDNLTYAGNLDNLKDIKNTDYPNYFFEKVDITDIFALRKIFEKYKPDYIIHLAAETHVDRSIFEPSVFVQTNVVGTANLLDLCREFWDLDQDFSERKNIFYHISTDEVYGVCENGAFDENSPYNPKSPYSATKAGSDFLVKSYGNTYNLPFIISHCSNNYGPNHFPEKLIPLCIKNIIFEKNIPVYGDGKQIRDWIFVVDHSKAILKIFCEGKIGETYNIGSGNEYRNIDLIEEIILQVDEKLGRPKGYSKKLITFVKDRPGHDFRYAIDFSKLKNNLSWEPEFSFKEGISRTIDWYLENMDFLEKFK